MKKFLFMAVAAIAVLSSCSSDNDFEQNPIGNGGLVFTATMEGNDATRATYDTTDKCAAWEEGDKISINGKTYSAQKAGTITTFKADDEDATGETYNAYFPASLYNNGTPTLPVTQSYTAGKFDMPMYAESTTTELAFKNLCAVLAIKVTSADIATLKSIKVVSDKKMSGSFTVTDNKAVMGEDGANVVVLESSDALTLTEEGTVFYIAIPAQEYKYLNIFLSADGETYKQAMATKKATGIGTIDRSKIFNINYKKNATKLWAGNLFFADCNVGATSATEKGSMYGWANDIAESNWGDNWRMPTRKEFDALIDKCTYVNSGGYIFTGQGDYASNSIVLFSDAYWSSTISAEDKDDAYYLQHNSVDHKYKIWECCVRAVLQEPITGIDGSTGTATAYINQKSDNTIEVPWVRLWDYGPKFAAFNVGAKPGDNDYLSIGGAIFQLEKKGSGDNGVVDVVTTAWGYEYWKNSGQWICNWRMPTKGELQALLDNCECEWVENYKGYMGCNDERIQGLLCTGRGAYASNSIFLPTCYYGSSGTVGKLINGHYWSSTRDGLSIHSQSEGNIYALDFSYGDFFHLVIATYHLYEYKSFSVRAVLKE